MTYAIFLVTFLLPPLLLLTLYYFFRPSELRPWFTYGSWILVVIALIYTTPWDNYLVAQQVWNYPPDRVLAVIGYVPVEEYTFFVLQTFLTSFWCYWLQFRFPIQEKPSRGLRLRVLGALPLMGGWLLSFWLLSNEPTLYFGLILVWAIPVILLQWSVAAPYLPANWKLVCATILIPTLYLCAADLFAIHDGIWSLSPTQTTGWKFLGLPVEEALFFLLTNTMVGLGLIFFVAMRKQTKQWLLTRGVWR